MLRASKFITGHIILLAALSSTGSGLPFPTGPQTADNSSKECAICHIRWIESFGRGTPARSFGSTNKDRQAGSSDMCFSCHDGSVVDSRRKVWTTNNHVSGKPPPEWMKIPEDIFPLDKKGNITCATCHTAHAIDDGHDLDLGTVIFLRQPNVNSSLCVLCHTKHNDTNSIQHPFGRQVKRVPKKLLHTNGKKSSDGYSIVCQTCHEPHGSRNSKMLVLPASQLCVTCHEDKSGELSDSAHQAMHRMGRRFSGFSPPENLLVQGAQFGPGGELTCLSCHVIHQGANKQALLIQKNKQGSLCVECHKNQQSVLGDKHDLRRTAPDAVNIDGLSAAESGACGGCHKSHGWARARRPGKAARSPLCVECHLEGGLASEKHLYIEGHPIHISLPANLQVTLPLKGEERLITCSTCHDPHNMGHSVSMLRMPAEELCLHCHDEKQSIVGSIHDSRRNEADAFNVDGNGTESGVCGDCHKSHGWAEAGSGKVAKPPLCVECHLAGGLASEKYLYIEGHPIHVSLANDRQTALPLKGAERLITCATCHDPHIASHSTSMLRIPAKELCLQCHDEKRGTFGSLHDPAKGDWAGELGFKAQDLCTDCHPVHKNRDNPGLSALLERAGTVQLTCEGCHRREGPGQPAESKHLTRSTDSVSILSSNAGLIICTTCHDIHQQQRGNKLLRASRSDSMLCLHCHPDNQSLIGTPHDFKNSALDAPAVMGAEVDSSGRCESCHLIHGGPQGKGPWAFETEGGRGYVESLCVGCHQTGKAGEGSIPQSADHPIVPLYNRIDSENSGSMPTYDEKGEQSSRGMISCLSCHDPHLGTTIQEPDASGEYRGMGKFLRPFSQQKLCDNCHGEESIWRYLYFHKRDVLPLSWYRNQN